MYELINKAPAIQVKVIPTLARLDVIIVMLFKGASIAMYLSIFTASNDIVDKNAKYPLSKLVTKQTAGCTDNGSKVCRDADKKRGKVHNNPISRSALVSDIMKSFVGVFMSDVCLKTKRHIEFPPMMRTDSRP